MVARFVRFAALVPLAGALVALTASADAGEGEVVVPGLGTAVELNLVSQGPTGFAVVNPTYDLRTSTAVAYGVGADALRTGTVLGRSPDARLLPVRSTPGAANPTVVESNTNAGGAVWTWTYGGTQYVNDYDNGRQIQSAFHTQIGGRVYNPTESGDEWSNVLLDPDLRHGSPTASATTSGTSQSTRAIPLEWQPRRLSPTGGTFTPVLWRDVRLGKDVTLDVDGMTGVARYRSVLTLPSAVSGHLEMPTAYLRGTFDTYYGVDARAGTATRLAPADYDPLRPPAGNGLDYVPASGRGGVVAATADGRHAMGIYGVTAAAGGPVTTFTVHDFVPNRLWQAIPGFGTGQFDFSTSKLRAMRSGSFPAGTSTYETFVVTGTLDEVVARMRVLARP